MGFLFIIPKYMYHILQASKVIQKKLSLSLYKRNYKSLNVSYVGLLQTETEHN